MPLERTGGKHKEKGHTQKPYLNQSIGPALVELAKRVTIADPIEIQKAACYVYELGLYIQSDDYKERRERHNSSTRKSRQARKPHYVIRSESEDGYWSNKLGWVDRELASVFTSTEFSMPVSLNNDAEWEML